MITITTSITTIIIPQLQLHLSLLDNDNDRIITDHNQDGLYHVICLCLLTNEGERCLCQTFDVLSFGKLATSKPNLQRANYQYF